MQLPSILQPASARRTISRPTRRCWTGARPATAAKCCVFWEPRETFVVVGYANRVATEVNVAACAAKGVPIFRRCSGGGAVVQMPGGLNYSLILRITENGPTRNISAANQFIMERNRAAIASGSRPANPAKFPSAATPTLCLGRL